MMCLYNINYKNLEQVKISKIIILDSKASQMLETFLLLFHHSVVRIPFALMPVFLLAAQPAAISLAKGPAKVNSTVKMRAFAEKWDSL